MASLVDLVAPLVEVVLAAAGNSSIPIQISKHYFIKKAPTLKGWRFFYIDFFTRLRWSNRHPQGYDHSTHKQ